MFDLKQQQEHRQRVVLLAKNAYALSGLVEAFIYQGAPTGELDVLSLKQLADRRAAGAREGPHAERWDRAIYVLSSSGMPVQTLIKSDQCLRSRVLPAYSNWHQEAEVSLESLIQWADAYIPSQAVLKVKAYIEMLGSFSSTTSPFAQTGPSCASIFEAQSSHHIELVDCLIRLFTQS